jgi:hypothetical protein
MDKKQSNSIHERYFHEEGPVFLIAYYLHHSCICFFELPNMLVQRKDESGW